MTPLRFLARLLVVAALLAAQHTALSHEMWHADESGDPKQQQLCDFHDALGSVLGAIGGSANAHEPPSPSDVPIEADRTPAASRSGLTPSSRDPPRLL